jgi:hypothetical protein
MLFFKVRFISLSISLYRAKVSFVSVVSFVGSRALAKNLRCYFSSMELL